MAAHDRDASKRQCRNVLFGKEEIWLGFGALGRKERGKWLV